MFLGPRFLVWIMAIAIALLPSPGKAQTVWHMPGAWPNLHEAVASASSGDIIELADDLYDAIGWRGLSVNKTLTFRSASMDSSQCVIDCGGTFWASFEDGMPYGGSRIEGIGFRNAGGGTGSFTDGAISVKGHETVTIFGCDFENNTPTSVSGWAYIENCSFRNHPVGSVATQPLQVLNSVFESNAGSSVLSTNAGAVQAVPFVGGCDFTNNTHALAVVLEARGASLWTPVIDGCMFEGNTGLATVVGGSGLEVSNSTFSGNTSSSGGGAITITNGSNVKISTCTFTGNTAVDYGGALAVAGTGLTELTGCVFLGNTVASTATSVGVRGGGGAYVEGSITVEDCSFEGNVTSGAYPTFGGGLLLKGDGDASIGMDSRFLSNHADWYGGGIAMVRTSMTPTTFSLTQVLITDNVAVEAGGGLAVVGTDANLSTLNVTRTTIANNSLVPGLGSFGSGVLVGDAALNLERSIVAYNRGGPAFHITDCTNLTASCTDIYGHDPPDSDWTGCLDGFESFYNNLEAQPKFCSIASIDYELAPDSPCLATNSPCMLLMGWGGVGSCITSSVEPASWGAIKAMYR